MSVRQLLYHSRATRRMGEADLGEMLEEARRLNLEHGVTGLLLYVDGHFMQCIEGGSPAIGQLARNIQADDRNTAFSILLDRSVPERAFPGWTMGFHAPTTSELRNAPGFSAIQRADDLDTIPHRDRIVFDLMRNFYIANSGRGF